MQKIVIAVTGLLVFVGAAGLNAQALKGSRTAMRTGRTATITEDG